MTTDLLYKMLGALLATQDQQQHSVPAAQGRGGRNCWIDVCYQSQAYCQHNNKQEGRCPNKQSLLWRKYHGLWRNWWKVRPGQDTLQITLQVFWDAFQDAWDSVWRKQLSHLSKNPASNVRAAETLDTELNQGGTSETMTTNTNTEQMTWEGGHKYCSIYRSIKWLGLIFTKGSVKFVWKLLKLYSTMYPLLFFQVCACAGLIF